MIVREATPSDLEAIMVLEAEAFGDHGWSEGSWAGELGQGCFVSVDGDQVCGVVTFTEVAEVADLNRIVVAEPLRGRGFADALMVRGLRWAADAGAKSVMLEVESDNGPALRLYARHGFTAVAQRRDYYGTGRHAVVMETVAVTSHRQEDAWASR